MDHEHPQFIMVPWLVWVWWCFAMSQAMPQAMVGLAKPPVSWNSLGAPTPSTPPRPPPPRRPPRPQRRQRPPHRRRTVWRGEEFREKNPNGTTWVFQIQHKIGNLGSQLKKWVLNWIFFFFFSFRILVKCPSSCWKYFKRGPQYAATNMLWVIKLPACLVFTSQLCWLYQLYQYSVSGSPIFCGLSRHLSHFLVTASCWSEVESNTTAENTPPSGELSIFHAVVT